MRGRLASLLLGLVLAGGCALHPAGETAERDRIREAGAPYEAGAAARALPEAPRIEDYLRVAFFANAELEARYFAWKAAIEQVPQDASLPNASVSFSYLFSGGNLKAWDRSTLGIGNDPMANIPFPTKLAAAGRRALQDARAAGLRFEAAKFALQEQVLGAYYDLALLAESLRLQAESLRIEEARAQLERAGVQAGRAPLEAALAAQTEVDPARNELENLRAGAAPAVAAMNALLGRPQDAPLPLPAALPPPRPLPWPADKLLALGAERNSELAALAREVAGREEALDLARQAYLPDFGISASFMGSVSQTVGGMLTLPLRLEAIGAAVAQAEAALRAARAARVKYARDLAATFVLQLAIAANAERQTALLERTLIPRALRALELARAGYAAGRGRYLDIAAAQRTLLAARKTAAQARIEREKALAALEAAAAIDFEACGTPEPMESLAAPPRRT